MMNELRRAECRRPRDAAARGSLRRADGGARAGSRTGPPADAPDQIVPEDEVPGAVGRGEDDARLAGGLQRVDEVSRIELRDVTEQAEVEVAAHHRRGGRAASSPPGRALEGAAARCRAPAPSARARRRAEEPSRRKGRRSSTMKKGLPALLAKTARLTSLAGVPSQRCGVLGHVGCRQAVELDVLAVAMTEDLRQTRVRREGSVLRTVARIDERHARDLRREIGEQPQRGRVGPLQVVEHEQQRALVGQLLQGPRDAVEQPVARGVRSPAGRTALGRQRGQRAVDAGRAAAEAPGVPERAAKELDEGPERGGGLELAAVPPSRRDAELARLLRRQTRRAASCRCRAPPRSPRSARAPCALARDILHSRERRAPAHEGDVAAVGRVVRDARSRTVPTKR